MILKTSLWIMFIIKHGKKRHKLVSEFSPMLSYKIRSSYRNNLGGNEYLSAPTSAVSVSHNQQFDICLLPCIFHELFTLLPAFLVQAHWTTWQ